MLFGRKWEKISKYLVKTKKPTQLGSHAQKLCKWDSSSTKRKSIHSIRDIKLTDVREFFQKRLISYDIMIKLRDKMHENNNKFSWCLFI